MKCPNFCFAARVFFFSLAAYSSVTPRKRFWCSAEIVGHPQILIYIPEQHFLLQFLIQGPAASFKIQFTGFTYRSKISAQHSRSSEMIQICN